MTTIQLFKKEQSSKFFLIMEKRFQFSKFVFVLRSSSCNFPQRWNQKSNFEGKSSLPIYYRETFLAFLNVENAKNNPVLVIELALMDSNMYGVAGMSSKHVSRSDLAQPIFLPMRILCQEYDSFSYNDLPSLLFLKMNFKEKRIPTNTKNFKI